MRPPIAPWPRREIPYGDGHAAERIVERIRRYFREDVGDEKAA